MISVSLLLLKLYIIVETEAKRIEIKIRRELFNFWSLRFVDAEDGAIKLWISVTPE